MNSVGVFLEKEINGELFLVFNFPSQSNNFSSSSSSFSGEAAIVSAGNNDLSLQPHFLCPRLRSEAERIKRQPPNLYQTLPYTTSPYMESDDEYVKDLIGPYSPHEEYCKQPVLPLFWCNEKSKTRYDPDSNCLNCSVLDSGGGYYLCVSCEYIYHKECVESPLFIKHPFFPFLSLQLWTHDDLVKCICCNAYVSGICYHSPISNINMHLFCALKSIPIFIDHPKRHPHSLTFFPKQNFLPCTICGLIKPLIPTYVCSRCAFVAHQDCIYFPYVIRISRHPHRISFTYSLPSQNLFCGVCRLKVDNDYGAYSCNQCDDYFVHSRCALRDDLWDGKELEGVPEEVEIVVEPFETMPDGTIRHFSHDHHYLRLAFITVYDENKYCQACVLPIYDGNYYSCVDDHCDFILHQTCASAPLRRHHPLNARVLTLQVVTEEYDGNDGYFICHACWRESCGFVYEEESNSRRFELDLQCASVAEPFKYEGHEHLLFLALSPEEEDEAICHICRHESILRKLNCIECNFILCFKCATIPYKVMYKHDKHFLTFRKFKMGNDQSDWCEACENKTVCPEYGGFYACDDYCCTSLHVECLLGKDPYMKDGQIVRHPDNSKIKIHIARNNTMSRPYCQYKRCGKRSPYRVIFKGNELIFCSFKCFTRNYDS